MEHKRYIARRRARFDGIDGKVNIPYGTVLSNQGGFLIHQNKRVCTVSSQNALDYFVQDDDGAGDLRGKLVDSILRFNDELIDDKHHTREHFIEILAIIDAYEDYCRSHPDYKNNRCICAVANIKRVYNERLQKHDFS